MANVSVITTDWPPVIATRPMPLAADRFGRARASRPHPASRRGPLTLTAPLCRTIEVHTAAGVAKDPVCENVARAPASVMPPFHTTIGWRAAAGEGSRKTAGLAHALDVHPEHARRRIGGHHVDIVRGFDHQDVTDRGRLVDADSTCRRLRTEVDRMRAALRDKAERRRARPH